MRTIAIEARRPTRSLGLRGRVRGALAAFGADGDDDPGAGGRPHRQRSFLVLRTVTVLVGAVVAATIVFLFVFPTAQWRDQRGRIDDASVQVEEAEAEIATLEQRIDDLEDPRTIERIARDRFGFVRPDEAAFRLQPPPADAATFPEAWPWEGFTHLVNGQT